jgi:hypothetical protein
MRGRGVSSRLLVTFPTASAALRLSPISPSWRRLASANRCSTMILVSSPRCLALSGQLAALAAGLLSKWTVDAASCFVHGIVCGFMWRFVLPTRREHEANQTGAVHEFA